MAAVQGSPENFKITTTFDYEYGEMDRGEAKTWLSHYIPEKAKLFTGILYRDSADLSSVEEKLNQNFGPSDLRSSPILFDNTEYYREIGEPLYKSTPFL